MITETDVEKHSSKNQIFKNQPFKNHTSENTGAVQKKRLNTRKIVMIGMMGAISAVLMLFDFRLPFAPAFAKMDFSELPIILCGFMFEPVSGILTVLVKIILNFMLHGTETMGVGELANFIGSVSYMLPAVLIYRKMQKRKGAVTGLIVATVFASGLALLTNLYLIFPIYAKMYNISLDAIVAMGNAVNPAVHDMVGLMIFSMLPFNLIKYSAVSIITLLVYKKIAVVIRKYTE